MKTILRQGWSRCSWEAQLLLAAFGITIVAHTVLFLMIVILGSGNS